MSDFFYDIGRKRVAAPARPLGRPPAPRGAVQNGTIVRLLVGQSHGFIRLADGREIFFHRSDVREGTSFNDFNVGDDVAFELLEDRVSGPRACSVRRPRRRG